MLKPSYCISTRPVNHQITAANDDHARTRFERAASISGWREIARQDLPVTLEACEELAKTLAKVRVADRRIALALRAGGEAGLVGALIKISRAPRVSMHHLDLLASALMLRALSGGCKARLIIDHLRLRFGAIPLDWNRQARKADTMSRHCRQRIKAC